MRKWSIAIIWSWSANRRNRTRNERTNGNARGPACMVCGSNPIGSGVSTSLVFFHLMWVLLPLFWPATQTVWPQSAANTTPGLLCFQSVGMEYWQLMMAVQTIIFPFCYFSKFFCSDRVTVIPLRCRYHSPVY